jgi:hypothetical protein
MIKKPDLDSVYEPSQDIVAREIEGAIIIVPIVSGIADIEDELLTLNETGKAIWQRLDGRRKLGEIVRELAEEFAASADEIERDVLGLVLELLRRGMITTIVPDRSRE